MMAPPPDPTASAKGGKDKRCKACGKFISEHNEKELRNCENFNDYMEHRKND